MHSADPYAPNDLSELPTRRLSSSGYVKMGLFFPPSPAQFFDCSMAELFLVLSADFFPRASVFHRAKVVSVPVFRLDPDAEVPPFSRTFTFPFYRRAVDERFSAPVNFFVLPGVLVLLLGVTSFDFFRALL